MRDVLKDAGARILNASEIAQETGSVGFVGGVLSVKGGILHPLKYARGLAEAVRAKGGHIYERSPMLAHETVSNGVRVLTPEGSVFARKVVLATNAYSDLTPGTKQVRRAVIPFRSAIIATEPLPEVWSRQLLRSNRSYSETRRMMRWFRRAGNRLLFGGRGAFGVQDSNSAYDALERAFRSLFPQLSGVRLSHRWSGLVAMTMDSLPQVGKLDDRVSFALGYNGSGVGMSSLLGRYAVDIAMGGKPNLGLLLRRDVEPIPFFALRQPAVRLVAGWYQLQDRIGR